MELQRPSIWNGFCVYLRSVYKKDKIVCKEWSKELTSNSCFPLLVLIGGNKAFDLLKDNENVGWFFLILHKLEELFLEAIVLAYKDYECQQHGLSKKNSESHQDSHYGVIVNNINQDIPKDSLVSYKEANDSATSQKLSVSESTQDCISIYDSKVLQENVQQTQNVNDISKSNDNSIDFVVHHKYEYDSMEHVSPKNKKHKSEFEHIEHISVKDLTIRRSLRKLKVSSRYSDNKDTIRNLLKPALVKPIKSPNCVCSCCKKDFQCTKLLLSHWKSDEKNKKKGLPFLCIVCEETFSSFNQMKAHFNEHSSNTSIGNSKKVKEKDKCLKPYTNNLANVDDCQKTKKVEEVEQKVEQLSGSKCLFVESEGHQALEKNVNLDGHKADCTIKVEDIMFSCKRCDSVFMCRKSFLNHQRNHVGTAKMNCDVPGSKSNNNKTYKKRPYRRKGKFPCRYCKKCFNYERNLEFHTLMHTGEKPYKCEICKKCFRLRRSLLSHLRLHDESAHIKCEHCSKIFVCLRALESHKLVHIDEKPFSCETCGKKFRRLLGLNNHKRLHKREELIKCDQCEKLFVDKWGMLRHKTIHTGEKPFACLTCGKTFRLKKGLLDHAKLHDKNTHIKCHLCPRTFIEKRKLDRHVLAHKGEKPYICDKCGKGFMNSTNLKVHNRCHTGEKPYQCSFCDRSFNQQGPLNAHERNHKGERPFVCELCGYGFVTKSQLAIHIRKHNDERPYKCDKCDYAGFTGSLLKIHKLKHSDEKPFKCLQCDASFKRQQHLDMHGKTHRSNTSSFEDTVTIVSTADLKDEAGTKDEFDARDHNCIYCSKSFESEELLNAHVDDHAIVVLTETSVNDDMFPSDIGSEEVAYTLVIK